MLQTSFQYNDSDIEFITNGKGNIMINATQMAKIYSKRVVYFMENENTKSFIKSCLKSRNSDFLKVENELSFTEIGRFLDRFEKDVNTFHEEVKKIVEKEKQKQKITL